MGAGRRIGKDREKYRKGGRKGTGEVERAEGKESRFRSGIGPR